MLVLQPLQSGGGDVVFESRPRFVAHRFSERSLFSHLPVCHGISVLVGDVLSEWPRLGFPLMSKTKFVAFRVPLLVAVIPGKPLFQLFFQLLHGSYRSDSVLHAKLFATFLARNDFRIRTLGRIALA